MAAEPRRGCVQRLENLRVMELGIPPLVWEAQLILLRRLETFTDPETVRAQGWAREEQGLYPGFLGLRRWCDDERCGWSGE